MRQHPVYHSIIIMLLLACIFLVLKFLPGLLNQSIDQPDLESQLDQEELEHKIDSGVTFHYSSVPKLVRITDSENVLLHEVTSFDDDSEYNSPNLLLPLDQQGHTNLRLEVEWEDQPVSFHFFTIVFVSAPLEKFGLDSVTSELTEEFTVLWK